VYDEDFFYNHLSIREMKLIVASFYPTWNEDAFRRYLDEFGLPERKKIRDLSKGMRTKFALAAALAHDPELLVMDEPTSGLDPVFRQELLSVLSDYIRDGTKSVLFSTHICADLERIADYIVYIGRGELRFSGTKEKLFDRYAIVKGPVELLRDELPFVGLRQTRHGFEGLLDRERIGTEALDPALLMERPTLDDIVVFTREGA
jgi:ABC-2 type transport system ATP-binding protein